MADLHDVAMFCLFYSGIVLCSLWMTIAQMAPARVSAKKDRRRAS